VHQGGGGGGGGGGGDDNVHDDDDNGVERDRMRARRSIDRELYSNNRQRRTLTNFEMATLLKKKKKKKPDIF